MRSNVPIEVEQQNDAANIDTNGTSLVSDSSFDSTVSNTNLVYDDVSEAEEETEMCVENSQTQNDFCDNVPDSQHDELVNHSEPMETSNRATNAMVPYSLTSEVEEVIDDSAENEIPEQKPFNIVHVFPSSVNTTIDLTEMEVIQNILVRNIENKHVFGNQIQKATEQNSTTGGAEKTQTEINTNEEDAKPFDIRHVFPSLVNTTIDLTEVEVLQDILVRNIENQYNFALQNNTPSERHPQEAKPFDVQHIFPINMDTVIDLVNANENSSNRDASSESNNHDMRSLFGDMQYERNVSWKTFNVRNTFSKT